MNTTTPLPAFLLFLLFAFTTEAEIVYDSDGDFVRNGGTYVFSILEANGGGTLIGAAIRKGDSDACSLGVVQYPSGWPVTIQARVLPTFISTNFQLHLSFSSFYFPPNICTNSSNWLVVTSVPVGLPVMVGDAQEFGDDVVSGWFYIKPHDSANKLYKLVFCRDPKTDECGNIGVHIDSHDKRLAVTDGEPLVFKLDKVKERRFASKSRLSMA